MPHAENLSHMAGRTGYGEGGDEDESHGHVYKYNNSDLIYLEFLSK